MKKVFLLLVLLFDFLPVFSSSNVLIDDSRIKKDEIFAVVKKWALITLKAKDVNVIYEDKESGDIIVDGVYFDSHNSLTLKIWHYVYPSVNFQLEIKCKDGCVRADFVKLRYSYEVIGDDYHGLTNSLINLLIDELEAILHVAQTHGESFEIDESIENEYKEIDSIYHEASLKMDDKTLPGKERRKYKKIYEKHRGLYWVYSAAHWAKYYMSKELLEEEDNSLSQYIKKYLDD